MKIIKTKAQVIEYLESVKPNKNMGISNDACACPVFYMFSDMHGNDSDIDLLGVIIGEHGYYLGYWRNDEYYKYFLPKWLGRVVYTIDTKYREQISAGTLLHIVKEVA